MELILTADHVSRVLHRVQHVRHQQQHAHHALLQHHYRVHQLAYSALIHVQPALLLT